MAYFDNSQKTLKCIDGFVFEYDKQNKFFISKNLECLK